MTSQSILHPTPELSHSAARPARRKASVQLSPGLGLVVAATLSGLLWVTGVLSIHALLA
ncbi:MAG TPA: hypothetical protein VFE18_14745 [Phenylobacterium sp.]|jgi:hypothetical protein|uniref:hypothetical protein n=1 Tax=Phenylobacterium sp. TaxID=1871053 RepID=UPI002D2E7926|nr:hypothetical protein [Phenylobacterium sp.]HZZ69428.1 hypothetical protein [Phenylobacterium sp.]